ncbi:MAG TPA: hypothetical protein VM537_05265, partial [Anaerolineae bacterium]|nr:hypothetical protein [Anaerolineae bacterium]
MKPRMSAVFLVVVTLLVLVLPGPESAPHGLGSADLALAAPVSRHLSDAPWGTNVIVSDDVGSAEQSCSSIAVDPSGNAYAVWSDERNGNADIYFSYRASEGTWGPNTKVNDDSGTAPQYCPSIGVDHYGNADVVWYDSRKGDRDIYFSYRPSGGTWGPNVAVNDDAGTADQYWPSIAVDPNGNAYAVWLDFRGGGGDAYFSYRPVAGSWGANVRVNDDPGLTQQWVPSIAVDPSGNAYAVWSDYRDGGDRDIWFSYRASGATWGPNAKVSDYIGTAQQLNPSIAVDANGNAYAVWHDERNGDPDIYFSYRAWGGTWGPNIRVSDDPGTASQSYPSIAVDPSGNACTMWKDERNGVNEIYFSRRPAGGSWGSNGKVNDATGYQKLPSIAVDVGGNAYGVWSDYRKGNWDIYSSYLPAGGTGLVASHVEVTQAIQDRTNSVPLIEGKPTFVRVYVDCGVGCTSRRGVTGSLRGYALSGEIDGSPLVAVNRFITAYHQPWRDQRGELEKTLNFNLPPDWSTGTVTLVAEVAGATRSESVTFEPARNRNIIHLPIRYSGQEPTSRIDNASYWARRVWPTADINYVRWPTMEWSPPLGCLRFLLDQDDYVDCVSDDLKNKLTERYRQGHVGGYIFGWLPADAQIGVGGSSDPAWYGGAGRAAFGLDDPTEGPRIFAHEIGHLMGGRHTNTGECAPPDIDPDTDWPYGNAKIQEYGIDGYGFGWLLSSSSAVKNPSDTYDYMSYCGSLAEDTVWTSPWTYERVYSEALQLEVADLEGGLLSGAESYFISSGLVFTDDTATLDPIWVISSTVSPENPAVGTQYCLEAQDSSQVALVSRCFDLAFTNYETGEATDVDGFSLMLPYPSGVDRVVLKKGTTELATQSVSASAPSVTVVSPNGGETWAPTGGYEISWSASDADGDTLTYS